MSGMKKLSRVILGVVIVFSISKPVGAETLLGSNYAGVGVGIVKFGDDFLNDAVGNAYGINGIGNINLMPKLDLILGASYLWANGDFLGTDISTSALAGTLGLRYHFLPATKVNPYVDGNIGLFHSSVDVGGFEDSQTDGGFGVGGGVEIEIAPPVLTRLGISYDRVDNFDEVSLYGSAGYWFTDSTLASLGITYGTDTEDFIFDLGVIFKM